MKILRTKMYNRETKDCELNIQFTDKEMKEYIKESGFIKEDYICMTSFNIEYLGYRSGVIYTGMEHNKEYKLGFELEHKWNIKEDKKYYIINVVDYNKTYMYADDMTLPTLQKRFILDIIKDGYLKY
ncbi:hypothetical protein [Clostridium sp.]|uniref:hypothetical protein n=1 Tax=Clostridium sp. TaxID=1506 RepID=UPI001D28FE9F|nr:hypothetical protein [Clostridium sp.]MBS5307746.1 hypothetical protein [Clostridium sp.]